MLANILPQGVVAEVIMVDKSEKLFELAREKFGQLSSADEKLFSAAAVGNIADYNCADLNLDDPSNAEKWGDERTVQAEKIVWCCTDSKVSELLTPKGLIILGAKVEGEIDLQFTIIHMPLVFTSCVFTKSLLLKQANIRGLYLEGTQVASVNASRIEVQGSISLSNGFNAAGLVDLTGASISSDLNCIGGKFHNQSGDALNAEGVSVKGHVFLKEGFEAMGVVNLYGATIDRNLECMGGKFHNQGGDALNAERVIVKGHVFLKEGFEAEGVVNLHGATIDGNLECIGGKFHNKNGNALYAEGVSVKGSVFLRDGFEAEGMVNLVSAEFVGYLELINITKPSLMKLDLRSAKVGTLLDEESCWPEKDNLFLNGFVYNAIHERAPLDYKTRLRWIRLQPELPFSPQPYEQLANVLRETGHERAVIEVLIGKQKDRLRFGELTLWGKFSNKLLGTVIAYGYRPHQALRFVLIFVLVGTLLYGLGYSSSLFSPSKIGPYKSKTTSNEGQLKEDYPTFNALAYSIDVFNN